MRTTLEITGQIKLVGAHPYVLVSGAQGSHTTQLAPTNARKGEDQWPVRSSMAHQHDAHGSRVFLLYLQGGMGKASQTQVHDVVTIKLSFDQEYRNGPLHETPEWFQSALYQDPVVAKNCGNLTPSRQKEVRRHFSALKSEEAKERNLARVLKVLRGERARFMGRDWLDGK